MGNRRLATWALMLGSIFPDCDVLRDFFSRDQLLMITWHRSITHSLLLLPVWSVLLAAVALALARWRKWQAPSFTALTGLFAVGILSHIVLDLVTTFGTMIWSPLEWSRPAWEILFIVDFTFTAILLLPQLLAWTFEDPEHARRRAIVMFIIFSPAPFVISRIALFVGAPISDTVVFVATALFAVLFLFPAMGGLGARVSYERWNRLGLTMAIAYVLAATYAHHVAYGRVKQFAAQQGIQVEAIGALPFPPSLWRWDGLVRAPRGVYEMRMDLADGLFPGNTAAPASWSTPIIPMHFRISSSRKRAGSPRCRRCCGLRAFQSRVFIRTETTPSSSFQTCGLCKFAGTAPLRLPTACASRPTGRFSRKAG